MRLVCPNNSHEHTTFSTMVHVTQEWEVCEDGTYNSTIEPHVETITEPNTQDHVFFCTVCGAEALTKGEIVTVYATISDEDMPYLDIFDNEEDAKNEIGKIYDGDEISGYIKGYSLRPVGGTYLYSDAPDFCFNIEEAIYNAERLGIELKSLSPVI